MHTVFQPIVDLSTHRVIGYEALSVTDLPQTVDELFTTCDDVSFVEDLDWHCRGMAASSAINEGLSESMMLFVNIEPSVLWSGAARHQNEVLSLSAARSHFHVIYEITERKLSKHISSVLAFADNARNAGCGIALDDMGTDAETINLIALVRPEFLKLDRSVTQATVSSHAQSTLVPILQQETRRSGSVIIAEGIETAAQEDYAVLLGATLGQGWRFGCPMALIGSSAGHEVAPHEG